MNSWKVILVTLVIFGAGVITGGLLVMHSDSVVRHPRREGQQKITATANPAGLARNNRPLIPQNFLMRTTLLDKLDHELKLSATQREHIEKIIHEGQDRIKNLCEEIEPELHEELAETREKILAELTPAQEPLFTELLKRRPNPAKAGTNPLSPATLVNPVRVNTP